MVNQIKQLSALGLALLLSGCITEIEGYQKPKPKAPDIAAKSYYDLGVAYMGKGRYDLAESKLLQSLKVSPTAEAYNAIAVLYEEQHDNALAEESYQTLVGRFPKYTRGYMNYSIFLCKNDRVSQMDALLKQMHSRGKELAAAGEIAAGDCAFNKGNEVKATAHYQKALQYEQHAAGALLPLAEIDLKQGRAQAAKQKVDTVNNYIGYSVRSVYLSVLANRELGNLTQERKMLNVLRTRYANTPEAAQLAD